MSTPNRPPDLTIEMLDFDEDEPSSRFCEGAKHLVPYDATFQGKPIKWYRISGPAIDKPTTVCEPCLIIAQAMAARKRSAKKRGFPVW